MPVPAISCSETHLITLMMIRKKHPHDYNRPHYFTKFRHWMSKIHFTFNKYNCLEIIAVCILYWLFVTIRWTVFLQFLHSIPFKALVCISKLKVQMINETCVNFKAERGKYRLNLFITPRKRDFFSNFLCVCELQLIHSITVNPGKLTP